MLRKSMILWVSWMLSASLWAQSSSSMPTTSVSVGLRTFINRVSGAGYSSAGIPGVAPFETAIDTQTAVSMLPSITVRYGVLVFTGSYHAKTSYDVVFSRSERFTNDRREWDFGIGYSVLPNLVIAVGQKTIDVAAHDASTNPTLSQKTSGPFLGVSTGATLAGPWSVYGSFAYGRPKLLIDGRRTGGDGQYLASEFGLRYELGDLAPALRGAGLLAGYRSQALHFRDVPFGTIRPSADGSLSFDNITHSIRQGIDGLSLGVTYTF